MLKGTLLGYLGCLFLIILFLLCVGLLLFWGGCFDVLQLFIFCLATGIGSLVVVYFFLLGVGSFFGYFVHHIIGKC